MKKYKFKIGQEVFIRTSFADETWVKIKKRKSHYGNFYLVSNSDTEWIPEEVLYEFKIEEDPSAICSKNGCEIINSFLEKTELELLQEQHDNIQEQINLKKYGLSFLKELIEKTENEIKMLEYDSSTIWNKIYNSSEYYKEHILEMIQ